MQSFQLDKYSARLAHFNPRSEMHGEDRQPAADLKLEIAIGKDALTLFSPTLAASWYDGDVLRNPKLEGPFSWDDEIVGATVTIHNGSELIDDITLPGCNVNGFKLTPQENGRVMVVLRVQCHPSETQAGRLYALIESMPDVTIRPAQLALPGV